MKNDVHQKIEAALKIMEGKDASVQTHTLRELGGGNMGIGLKMITEYISKNAKLKERAKGGMIATVAIGAVGGLYTFVKWIRQQDKESDEQAQKILTALESVMTPEEIAAAESGEAPDSTDENP